MKKNFLYLLSLTTMIIIFASCGKKAPNEAKYIPKDATIVIAIDSKSLGDKMSKGNIPLDTFISRLQKNADTISAKNKQYWEDFKNSGVSLDNNLYFFMLQKGSIQKGQSNIINVMATLKDQAKFEAYLKKQDGTKDSAIVKGNNYSYISSENNSMIAWNKDVVIATNFTSTAKPTFDSTGAYQMPEASDGKAAMLKEVERFFNQKESESVASLEVYNNMFKEKADGYLFGTSSAALAMLSTTPLNLPKLQELLKDNYSASTFNFEDGKIVAKGTSYTNPFLSSILKKYAGPTVNISALEKFPSQNINGAMLASFNPELFSGLLKELEVSGLVDVFLNKQGLTSADIFKALKGEINVVVSDFAMGMQERSIPMPDGTTYKSTTEMPSAKMVFTASIGDKAAFAKLMDKAIESGAVVKTNGGYAAGEILKSLNLFLKVDDKNFILASDSATYVAYMSGTGKSNIASDVVSKMKGKSVAAFIDINSILKSFMGITKDNTTNKNFVLVNNTFKDFVSTVDNFDGKGVKSDFEVRMVDTKQNSLVSVLNMIVGLVDGLKEGAVLPSNIDEKETMK